MSTKTEATQAIGTLRQFIGKSQLSAIGDACQSEEKQYFFDKLVEMAGIINAMPKTYEQDGKGDQAIAYLHYFRGGMDWYITERDMETADGPGQHQAFGLADLGDGGELGYISIVELLANGIELDLHFAPKTLAQIRQ